MLPQQPQSLGIVRPIGQDHASFTGANDLARMEREADQLRVAANGLTAVASAQGAGRVLHDGDAVPPGDGLEASDICGQADLVHGHDRLRPERDGRFRGFRVEVVSERIHLGEDR